MLDPSTCAAMRTVIETIVVRWMCELAGLGSAAGGTFTSGGTEATTTALLAARNARFPNAWADGVHGPAAIVCGADAHYAISRAAGILGIELQGDAGSEVARRSRGTPRIANRLLRRVRDFAEVRADGVITRDIAKSALAVYDVDELGLDRLDRAVLSALTRSFGGGPVGVSTLAAGHRELICSMNQASAFSTVRATRRC